jgi:hypothetical protein
MTENTTVETTADASAEQQQISVEQILAAVLAKFGPVLIQPDLLTMDYSKYSVQVDQDPKTGFVMFGLIDNEVAAAAAAKAVEEAQDTATDSE